MKAGKERKVRRIQEVLDDLRMTFADVARGLEISPPLVWRTAHGLANNRRILRRFLELGVKAADLDLPESMRAEIENRKGKVA